MQCYAVVDKTKQSIQNKKYMEKKLLMCVELISVELLAGSIWSLSLVTTVAVSLSLITVTTAGLYVVAVLVSLWAH